MRARGVANIQKDRWVFIYVFFIKVMTPIFIGAVMIGLIGCGGGGDGNGISSGSMFEVAEGVFVDSPIKRTLILERLVRTEVFCTWKARP